MEKKIRNSVVCGIIVPQYVHLEVYTSNIGSAFFTRVTFPIKDDMVAALRRVAEVKFIYNGRMEVVRGCKKGKCRWYVAIERHYEDLNKIYYASHVTAAEDCRFLKVEMRQAKIHALTNEIRNLGGFNY